MINNFFSLFDEAKGFLAGLRMHFGFSIFIDILIVAIIFYWVYLFLRETRAIRILYGFLVLFFAMLIAQIFNLILLNFILKYFTTALVVAIPIVFQPELRRALEKIGRPNFWSEINLSSDSISQVVEEIIDLTSEYSEKKIGALIVIARRSSLAEHIIGGTEMNAQISANLLKSIFYPKSSLHDGAVIIVGKKIISAGAILPVVDDEDIRNLGTRHRAAIGITSLTDAVAVVISEESGVVSIATHGNLDRRISSDQLKIRLTRLLSVGGRKKRNFLTNLFSRVKKLGKDEN